jgi:hypothetical protein
MKNPQRKRKVLATLDEVITMMDKGMDARSNMNMYKKYY